MAESWLGPSPSPSPCLTLNLPQFPCGRSHSMSTLRSQNPNNCRCSSSTPNPSPAQPSLLVFSGGTAFNGVVEELKNFTTHVAHVLPVSDDGGSTAEIVRVLGGPAVGDIRSRCLRLADKSTSESVAVRKLLGHRLPLDARQAKSEWYDIVEGEHSLWTGVSKPYRETIRAFLVYFQNQILRRSDESFCFSNGSIGNFFFAGARVFFQSLDAAIFLFSRVSDITSESLVLPVISTNDRLTLGCELSDGTIIRGQNEISHPTKGYMAPVNKATSYGVLNSINAAQTFEQWMAKYGRIYPNGQEKGKRFTIFQTNLEYVEKFNKLENKTYKLGLNQFSDMTNEEFLRYHTGYKKMPTTSSSSKSFRYQNLSDNDVPNSIDWRKQGAVTPVKNQADCGCCWAFSAVAAVEGITKVRTGQLISLSEQQLVDLMVDAFEYMKQIGVIAAEDNYQYTARDGACDRNKENEHVATITGHEQVPRGEGNLLKAVSKQPVSIGIAVDGQDFQHYRSGVFSGDCGLNLGHAVTAVGYGTTKDGTKYWLIKNSWGDNWAEHGYFRVLRENGRPGGQCGIAMDAAYPTA